MQMVQNPDSVKKNHQAYVIVCVIVRIKPAPWFSANTEDLRRRTNTRLGFLFAQAPQPEAKAIPEHL
jgi:hypothetical protein